MTSCALTSYQIVQSFCQTFTNLPLSTITPDYLQQVSIAYESLTVEEKQEIINNYFL